MMTLDEYGDGQVHPGRLGRWLRVGLLGGMTLVGCALFIGWYLLNASLATLDGTASMAGLSAPVLVERDSLGVPLIRASNRLDAARAMGFVHAQERYFQMDLMRRRGAGELSALFGSATVNLDESIRRHGLRGVAIASLRQLPANQQALLTAYTAGVNAGLASLGARPPEYFLLRSEPEPWRPEDSVLVGFAMFLTLQGDGGAMDFRRATILGALPPAAAEFFFPLASEWDAAIDDSVLPPAPVPGPDLLNFAAPNKPVATDSGVGAAGIELLPRAWRERMRFRGGSAEDDHLVPGSNSWGVHGAASATGGAIICNDMHLDLGIPNVWFRVCLEWTEAGGRNRRLVGASLAGVPTMVVGSNGDIAWGFTNATIDNADVVEIEVDPKSPLRYRAPGGWRKFDDVIETFIVRGGSVHRQRFQRTIWGPVIGDAGPGRKHVLLWTPQLSGGTDLGLLDMESAASVSEALALAPRCGVPVQNLLVGDRSGELAYTLMGRLPKRVGFDGSVPVAFGDGKALWDGWLSPEETPKFLAPAGSRLWTANNRVLGTSGYMALGTRDTDVGARARQIRDDLRALPAPVSEKDLMSIYRDDRAVFLERWQKLMLRVLAGPCPDSSSTAAARWLEARGWVENWGGRAATNSVGYPLVRAFRYRTLEHVVAPVIARCDSIRKGAVYVEDRHEAPVWAILEARPAHLLNPRFPTYDALLADAAQAILEEAGKAHPRLADATWGARNLVYFEHPLALAVPKLRRWLSLDPAPLPGDNGMPRVQGTGFGASERMVVSPGHEESGIFQMPGGQSGHFLSPYYRAGHEAWLRVEPSPLLPGPAQHRLVLQPEAP